MTIPPGKTPISYLQELCTKRGLTPQYDLIANEGAVHEPTFIMRVTVGDVVATGKGSSKKKAKHAAAQQALSQLLGIQAAPQHSATDCQSPAVVEEGIPGNPIGDLQEFTQKNLIRPPIYHFASEQGPPHAREFICLVKLGKFEERGTGRSKKTAKRSAAHAMLQRIKSLTEDGTKTTTIEDSDDDDVIPLTVEPRISSYSSLKERVTKMSYCNPAEINKEILNFYEKVVKPGGKGKNLNGENSYCSMLQDIADVQRFTISYVEMPELSTTGQFQCFVQMTTVPVAVCHGTGMSKEETQAQAAHNALQYLKAVAKT